MVVGRMASQVRRGREVVAGLANDGEGQAMVLMCRLLLPWSLLLDLSPRSGCCVVPSIALLASNLILRQSCDAEELATYAIAYDGPMTTC